MTPDSCSQTPAKFQIKIITCIINTYHIFQRSCYFFSGADHMTYGPERQLV